MADTGTLATFRIDGDKWERFKEKAKEADLSASAVILRFIDGFLAGDELPTAPNASSLPANVATVDQVQSAIAEMETRLMAVIEKKL